MLISQVFSERCWTLAFTWLIGNGPEPDEQEIPCIEIGRVFPLAWDRVNTLPICIDATYR